MTDIFCCFVPFSSCAGVVYCGVSVLPLVIRDGQELADYRRLVMAYINDH